MKFEPSEKNPSGTTYVAVLMKKPDTEEDKKLGKVQIRKPQNCGHVATVCVDCAETWSYDYHLMYERTAGGRRLRDDIEAKTNELR